MKDLFKSPIFWYVVAAIIAFYVISKILARFGIIKDSATLAKEKAVQDMRINADKWVFGTYIALPKGEKMKVLTSDKVNELSKLFKDSFDGSTLANLATLGLAQLGTSEEKFTAALRQCRSKYMWFQVAKKYREMYQKDLFTNALAELNDDESEVFVKYLQSLPTIVK